MKFLAALLLFLISLPCEAQLGMPAGIGMLGSVTVSPPPSGLVNVTARETTGVTQTNVPIVLGVPFSAGAITSSQHLVATDGISGSPMACDENNRYSDLAPAVRGTTLTCIIPSLTLNTTDTIALSVAAGAPGTGTDITIADIIAASASGPALLNSGVSIVDTTGTTYTASPLDGFNSGNTSFVNMTTAAVLGKWRSGGGIVTEYIVFVPLHNGGTPHPQLYAHFAVACFKASTAAVSGGNPILSCQTDVVMESGVMGTVFSGNKADYWYSLSVGPAGACANYPTTTPGTNLVMGANTSTFVTTITGGGVTQASAGGVVDDGTGYGVISASYTTSDVLLGVAKPFAGTTLTAGSYKIYGISHPYGTSYRVHCGWKASGTAPNVRVDNGNLYVGNPWNNSALTGGPAPYFVASRAILNYTVTPSQIAAHVGQQIVPTNPSGYQSAPGGVCCNGAGNGVSGSWFMYQQTSGAFDGVSPLPGSYLGWLVRYDNPGIIQDAEKYTTLPVHYVDSSTGVPSLLFNGASCTAGTIAGGTLTTTGCTGGAIKVGQQLVFPGTGTEYIAADLGGGQYTISNCCFGSGPFPITTNFDWWGASPPTTGSPSGVPITGWGSYPNGAHQPDPFFLPYVMTGDWYWLMKNVVNDWSLMIGGANQNNCGSGLTHIVTSNCPLNMRSNAHAFRNLAHTVFTLPDVDKGAVVGFTKTQMKVWLENQYVADNRAYTQFDTNGTIIQLGTAACPRGVCPGPAFLSPGPRWTGLNDSVTPGSFDQYQLDYYLYDITTVAEHGMLSPHGKELYSWLAEGILSQFYDTAEMNSIPISAGFEWFSTSTVDYTWAGQWRGTILIGNGFNLIQNLPGPGLDVIRTPAGTATLSATSGASITITVPSASPGYFAGTTFYVGAYFSTRDGGQCQIVASPAPTSNTVHCDTTVGAGHAFGATSYSNASYLGANWFMPGAAPGDNLGLEAAYVLASLAPGGEGVTADYGQLFQGSTVLVCDPQHIASITGCPAASNTILGGHGSMNDGQIYWTIAPR